MTTSQHWLVVGCGQSGFGAACLLHKQGHEVLISDRQAPKADIAAAIARLNIPIKIGPQDPSLLDRITHVLLSPGVSSSLPILEKARQLRIPICSEINLALQSYRGTVIGVTGTNGKSTTCKMLEHLLQKLGLEAIAGGNLGDPPTLMLAEERIKPYLILELSSYQLESTPGIRSAVAIFTSFSHDHIERHGSMRAYFVAKWQLVASLQPGSCLITKPDIWQQAQEYGLVLPDQISLILVDAATVAKSSDLDACQLDSAHNRLNAMFALLAASHICRRPWQSLCALLADFKGLPYRCQHLGVVQGKAVINDSKSTNVESTIMALASVAERCHLLLGGKGKGESYTPFVAHRKQLASVLCFGASGAEIYADLKGEVPAMLLPTLDAAISCLPQLMKAESATILFSPACASFDEFQNFEQRGAFFTTRIKELFHM